MIDPVTGWFEITQYSDKKVMTTANLVETIWLVQYTEFLDDEFKKHSKEK